MGKLWEIISSTGKYMQITEYIILKKNDNVFKKYNHTHKKTEDS